MSVPGKPLDKDLMYHYNVIYHYSNGPHSRTDETVLSRQVTEFLVDHLTQAGYNRGYYHERDCLPGRNLFTEMFRVVDSSQVTIVILTESFVKNYWSRYSQMASFKRLLDKDMAHKLIPVAVNLPETLLPTELNAQATVWLGEDWQRDFQSWNRIFRVLDEDVPVQYTLYQAPNQIIPEEESHSLQSLGQIHLSEPESGWPGTHSPATQNGDCSAGPASCPPLRQRPEGTILQPNGSADITDSPGSCGAEGSILPWSPGDSLEQAMTSAASHHLAGHPALAASHSLPFSQLSGRTEQLNLTTLTFPDRINHFLSTAEGNAQQQAVLISNGLVTAAGNGLSSNSTLETSRRVHPGPSHHNRFIQQPESTNRSQTNAVGSSDEVAQFAMECPENLSACYQESSLEMDGVVSTDQHAGINDPCRPLNSNVFETYIGHDDGEQTEVKTVLSSLAVTPDVTLSSHTDMMPSGQNLPCAMKSSSCTSSDLAATTSNQPSQIPLEEVNHRVPPTLGGGLTKTSFSPLLPSLRDTSGCMKGAENSKDEIIGLPPLESNSGSSTGKRNSEDDTASLPFLEGVSSSRKGDGNSEGETPSLPTLGKNDNCRKDIPKTLKSFGLPVFQFLCQTLRPDRLSY